MNATKVNWTRSGNVGLTERGGVIRRSTRGVWLVFDEHDRLIGEWPTREQAVANIGHELRVFGFNKIGDRTWVRAYKPVQGAIRWYYMPYHVWASGGPYDEWVM